MGRPRAFNSPQELEEKLIPYLEDCKARKLLPTKTGLALFVDVSKDTLLEYAKKEEYSASVKKIFTAIEEAWTQNLGKSYPVGSIFFLKNSFGWTDRMEQTNTNLNVFFVPKEIAQKHGLTLPEAPVPKVITVEAMEVSEPTAPIMEHDDIGAAA